MEPQLSPLAPSETALPVKSIKEEGKRPDATVYPKKIQQKQPQSTQE
jgi:hypothetical protein